MSKSEKTTEAQSPYYRYFTDHYVQLIKTFIGLYYLLNLHPPALQQQSQVPNRSGRVSNGTQTL